MVIRLIMVLILMVGMAGCLKKAGDENVSVEPAEQNAVALETPGDSQGMQASDADQVSAEVPSGEVVVFVKPSVQEIQQALKNANLYEGKIDGISGPKTRAAIESFQSQNGLKPDGKVGPKTWEKLKEYVNIKTE